MYVEDFISGEGEVEAAPQSHLPQLLGSLVSIEAAVAQQEADYKQEVSNTQSEGLFLTYLSLIVHFYQYKFPK